MTNLFYIMGKSATGKDTIYKRIKEEIDINEYILYTTRPKRTGETEGVDYHFVTDKQIEQFRVRNKVIESRTYQTVHGPWTYATIADDQLNKEGNILTIGTLESYNKIKNYYANNEQTRIFPIYIKVDEQERRKRAIEREQKQENPKFSEMERRLKADNIDFSEEKLKASGITQKQTYENNNLDECVEKIVNYIKISTILNYKSQLRKQTENYEEEKYMIEEEER